MYTLVYSAKAVKPSSQQVIIGVSKVSPYSKIGETAVVVGSSLVSNSGLADPRHPRWKMHGHSFPCYAERDMVLIQAT